MLDVPDIDTSIAGLPDFPELDEVLREYEILNPQARREEVRTKLARLFLKDPELGVFLGPRKLKDVSEALCLRIRAKTNQILGNQIWQETNYADPEGFRTSPRTKAKTIQEFACAEEDRIAFNTQEGSQGFETGMVIDSDLLTDNLLRILGLRQHVRKKGKRERAHQREKRRIEAIEDVRQMIAALEPILPERDMRYFRLMRIGKGPNEGFFLRTRNNNEDDRKIPARMDIYSAERMIVKEEESYQRELRILEFINNAIRDVRTELSRWRGAKASGELPQHIDVLKTQLLKCVDLLRHVKNSHKAELKKRIERNLDFRDRTGRANPAAASASLYFGQRDDLSARIREIERIWPTLGEDKVEIARIIAAEEAADPLPGFQTWAEQRQEGGQKKKEVINYLKKLRAQAEQAKFEPHLTFAKKWIEQVNKVIQALEEGTAEGDIRSGSEFAKLYLIAKIKDCYRKLLDIYRRLSLNPASINLAELYAEINDLDMTFREHKVVAHFPTPEYDDAFHKIYALIGGLKEMIKPIPEPATLSPRRKPHDRFDRIVNSLRQLPFIRNIINRVDSIIRRKLGMQETSETPSQQTFAPLNAKTIKKLKKTIRDFSFIDLMKEIPSNR